MRVCLCACCVCLRVCVCVCVGGCLFGGVCKLYCVFELLFVCALNCMCVAVVL